MKSATVLVLLRRTVVMQDAAAVVREMVRDGRFAPVIVCAIPELCARFADAVGVGLTFVNYSGSYTQSRRSVQGTRHVGHQALDSWSRKRYAIRALVTLARLTRARWRMRRLFDKFKPVAVVVFEDRAPHPEMVFLAEARRRGAKAVLVSFAASSLESVVVTRRDLPEHLVDHPPWRPVKRFLATRYPQQIYETHSGRLLFFPVAETLALALHGLLRGNNWYYGGGAVDLCTKIGEDDFEHARRDGAPVEKFIVTGQPSMDDLHRARTNAEVRRSELMSKYALPAGRPLIICAVPHSAEQAHIGWDRHMELTAQLFHALSVSGGNVLLSLHPRSDPKTYDDLARIGGCRIITERLNEVLPAADLFVATYSSTVRWAVAMHIPTIMVDFLNFNFAQFTGLPGTVVERDPIGVERTLQRLVGSPQERERLSNAAREGASTIAELDGNASKRIIDAIAGLLHRA
jgi:hypothetical protein